MYYCFIFSLPKQHNKYKIPLHIYMYLCAKENSRLTNFKHKYWVWCECLGGRRPWDIRGKWEAGTFLLPLTSKLRSYEKEHETNRQNCLLDYRYWHGIFSVYGHICNVDCVCHIHVCLTIKKTKKMRKRTKRSVVYHATPNQSHCFMTKSEVLSNNFKSKL